MNELAIQSASTLMMDDAAITRIERIAGLMASGKTTVPQHLRASPGDCFAIVMQAMQWGMNPFAVAQKTHLVNGTLGYEAQLVAAVINNSGIVSDRFNFEWFGPWHQVIGKFAIKRNDKGAEYRVPDWKAADEEGCGIRVWATIKGEAGPRELELLLSQARVRNSTLWADDPKQQLAYLAQKRWARLHAPDVILGVYTPDELEPTLSKDMGMIDVVPAKAPETYDQTRFDANVGGWATLIVNKGKTVDDMVAFIEKKGAKLSDGQREALAAKVQALRDAKVTDVQPKQTPDQAEEADEDGVIAEIGPRDIEKALTDATTVDELYAAGMHIDNLACTPEWLDHLNKLFTARKAELE
ncbi:hypothetical protein CCO03_17120 [Comamonas serinivorans]|uniref:Recombinase RecT n=1 Tax=Comamonas serinivorans TaxID=1082851 RepID=A0A1Y0ER84_9BURK|nr:RecT family recombinase [Comamonas serinivorans]ARU06167.1 hypothetical protein CCO03_17120 [Comamonas serinivorans]